MPRGLVTESAAAGAPHMHPMEHSIFDPRNRSPRGRYVGHQIVGIGVAQGGGHLVLFLQRQHVVGSPDTPMQLNPRCKQRVVGPGQTCTLAVDEKRWIGPVHPSERMHIP